MNAFAKICMVGWTILCFVGSCSGIVGLSHGGQGQILNGAEALGASIGLFMWLIIWAIPMVVLGIVALVTKPSAPSAPIAGLDGTSLQALTQNHSAQLKKGAKNFVFCLLVIAAIFVAYRSFTSSHPTETGSAIPDSSTASTGIDNESSGSGLALQVTANQLYVEYHENEVLADSKYKGRRLRVSGVVGEIGKGLLDEAVLRLGTSNRFESVDAYLNSSENSAAAALSKGAIVTVQCEGGGMIVGSPVLKGCRIENRSSETIEFTPSEGATPQLQTNPKAQTDTPTKSIVITNPNLTMPSTAHTIEEMDFGNMKYPFGKSYVQLENGFYHNSLGSGMVEDIELRNVWFLKETNGESGALIYIGDSTGKQDAGKLFLLERRDDNPVITEEIDFDLNANGSGVSAPSDIAGTFVILSRAEDGTAICCPKHLDVVTLQWDGNLLKRTLSRVDDIP